MKIYLTKPGILIEYEDRFCLETDENWDSLLNRHNLHDYLLARHTALPVCQDAAAILEKDLLPPVNSQELWASGVTYLRSKRERQEESKDSGGGDFYQRVYEAERPELFFKANLNRIVGCGGKVRIRADSTWNVPEPELTLVLNCRGEIIGYTVGNDMSSRSIEGENPLYLPQAKTYDGCAALGPCVFVTKDPFPADSIITLNISRKGVGIFTGQIAISQITRSFEDLAGFLFRECSFPHGALLMTGTGIVPESPFTLMHNDTVSISIDHIGTLINQVA
jgi:2-dehydro-3-deoxy-D-arabinonate dehydratase